MPIQMPLPGGMPNIPGNMPGAGGAAPGASQPQVTKCRVCPYVSNPCGYISCGVNRRCVVRPRTCFNCAHVFCVPAGSGGSDDSSSQAE
jgi:hypothetical protein